MEPQQQQRPLVSSGSTIPVQGNGHGNGGSGGAKNFWTTSGCQQQRQPTMGTQLYVATYNVRTLSSEGSLIELEEELERTRWDVVGLAEVRRNGEETMSLRSGNHFFYRGSASCSGVGFIINRSIVQNIISVGSISDRVCYLNLKISERYSLQMYQQQHVMTRRWSRRMRI